MKFTYLDWDSHFFSKKIGRLEVDSADNDTTIADEIEAHSKLDLLYIFSPENRPINTDPNTKINLVDTKVVYMLSLADENIQLNTAINPDFSITEYELPYTSVEVELLAFQSGEFSRFKTDPHFGPIHFYRLYNEWINKSVSGVLADKVFTAHDHFQTVGMVTVKFLRNTASIGLIAVSNIFKGKQIGSALLKKVVLASKERNIHYIFVATQKKNGRACKFYESNSFVKHQATNIYHYWY